MSGQVDGRLRKDGGCNIEGWVTKQRDGLLSTWMNG